MNSAIAHTNDPGKKNGNSMQINWEGKDILAQANAMPKSTMVNNRKILLQDLSSSTSTSSSIILNFELINFIL